MASLRDLWGAGFEEGRYPPWPCPTCTRGNLRIIEGSLRTLEPQYSKILHNSDEWSPLDDTVRFDCMFQCDVQWCGEVVTMYGNVELEPDYDLDGSSNYQRVFYPKGVYPAPPLAAIPKATPEEVSKQLRVASQLYWVDLGSCATRLRISVERILDAFEIPPGKLAKRIEAFKAKDPEHAETFDALRYVGNVGSHDGKNERDTILSAFEILQDALAQLFGKHKAHIQALKKKIIAAKGK